MANGNRPATVRALALALATLAPGACAQAADGCSARGAAFVPPVIELYTSEGCSSCPPADRWLSSLKRDPAVIAMAFHVDYWDRLGWKDRFASHAYSERQDLEQARRGENYSYTPQVVLDGRDHRSWRLARTPDNTGARPSASVDVSIVREADRYLATITPRGTDRVQLAAYWTVTENDYSSDVRAGENTGKALKHDYVVREYVQVKPWVASAPKTLEFVPSTVADATHVRAINLVIVDARTGVPAQAVKVGC